MIRGVNLKFTAICLMMLFIFQIAFPTVSFALTGGPSTPEVQGFTPVGPSDLVDLTTGNFNYSIPVMTVPGPNGGESLTLGYSAGATMEQEASWVGLGWDLNVGAINRNLRGLPDDFKGETIEQKHKQKTRIVDNYSFKGSIETEVLGLKTPEFGKSNTSIGTSITGGLNINYTTDNYYNNYLGFGLRPGVNFTSTTSTSETESAYNLEESLKRGEDHFDKVFKGISSHQNFRFGVNSGVDFTRDGLSIPIGLSGGYKSIGANLGLSFGGVQSLQYMNFGLSYRENIGKSGNTVYASSPSYGPSLSFAKVAPVPSVDISTNTTTTGMSFQFDKSAGPSAWGFGLGYDVYSTWTTYNYNNDKESYGYLYADFANKKHALTDFHVDKSLPFSDMASQLPLPVYDYDVFSVSGNGVGGTFRAYRNDIGVLSPSENYANSSNDGVGVQVSTSGYYGIDTKAGTKSTSYSGPWADWKGNGKSANNIEELEVGHKSENINKALYKPFYFQFTGGHESANEEYIKRTKNEEAVRYGVHISDKRVAKTLGMRTKSKFGQLSKGSGNKVQFPISETRQVATSHVSYKTNEELKQEVNDYPSKYKHLYPENSYPVNTAGSNIPYDQYHVSPDPTKNNGHHINEMSVESAGVKYVYGLPAYNDSTSEVMFSAPSASHNNHLIDIPSDYTTNSNGFDNLYNVKKIPKYAYSYLLTAKYSNNYVDINNDGPTNDDLGGWVKYNYTQIKDFNWRGPYSGASYLKGAYSWDKDDKATFTEGTKDIHYVNSIETKTHIAIFELGERNDNVSSANAAGSHNAGSPNMTSTKTSRFLKKIKLYSKKDPNYGDFSKMIPVKTAHFVYDYSQCQGIPNYKTSSNVYPQHIETANGNNRGGKLTLKKVYFTYQNNEKGSLTPYEFTYSNNNKPYTYMDHTGRWGNYLEAGNSKEFPYVDQSTTNNNDANAEAWNITKISTPSGGEVLVEYESDEYAYVQDKQAMQMCEILAIGDGAASITSELKFDDDLDNDNLPNFNNYIFFKGNKPFNNATEVLKYLENMPSKWLYFNVNVNLDVASGKNEMISGYAEIESLTTNDIGIKPIAGYGNAGYFRLKAAKYQVGRKKKNKEGFIHPFRKAALQHYHNRPDFKPTSANFNQMRQQIRTFIKGPIHNYLVEKKALQLVDNGPKNYIRLMNPDFHKQGGGHRVKSIRVFSPDNNETYGQKYFYTTYDEEGNEKSSGVADYEPITGGEENALRIPENYNDVLDYNTDTKGDFFLKKPYMEAFYPAPVVKYSKVITQSLTPKDLNPTAENVVNTGGITINEFYTSKDFPIIEITPNKLEVFHHKKRPSLPFVPMTTREDNAIFSNGSVIILNDMSGKPKSVSTYNSALLNNSPTGDFSALNASNVTTKAEYIYHTKEGDSKALDNKVTVLTDDGVTKTNTLIGQKQEFYVFEKEDFSLSRSLNSQLNVITTMTWPLWPSFNNSKSVSQRRMISTVKIIQKSGILKEVRTLDDGRQTTASNLAFDAQTGEAIVTKVQNDWDKSIYTYNYSGHWKYPVLQGKYQNYRAKFKVIDHGGSEPTYSLTGYSLNQGILQIGDVLRKSNGEMAYVTEIDSYNNQFKATTKKNTKVLNNNDIVTIYESGYKNLQGMKVGQIVSLTNPLTFVQPQNGFIEHIAYNLGQIHNNPYTYNGLQTYISNCLETYDYTLAASSPTSTNDAGVSTYERNVVTSGESCTFSIKLINQEGSSVALNGKHFDYSTLKKVSEGEFTLKYSYTGAAGTYIYDAYITSDCEVECDIKGVLHASAMQLSDSWEYNYQDAGDPQVNTDPTDSDVLSPLATELASGDYNKVAAGNKETWLPYKSWVYQVDRKQRGTTGLNGLQVDKDGEYKTFRLFKWNKADDKNQGNNWEWSTKMTKYSPYGNQLENKNRLGILSSELYGYNNTVVTAVAANASYEEIAYENFEESIADNFLNSYSLQGHFTGTVKTTLDGAAHTGTRALLLENSDPPLSLQQTNFKPKAGKKYHLSSWVKTYQGYGGTIEVFQSGTKLATFSTGYTTASNKDHGREIDRWTQVSGSFIAANSTNITLVFKRDGNSQVAFDDLRILPMKAAMKTYVYDSFNFNLIATLDDNNFATFYRRDSEGKLIHVKAETEKGIVTKQFSQKNIVK